MPTLTVSPTGHVSAAGINQQGSYHSSAIIMPDTVRDAGSIFVGVGEAQILPAGNNACIWTDSFQVCFPVVLLFRNGDIGLFHGNIRTIDIPQFRALYNRADLDEIQLFEKGTDKNNSGRVQFVAEALVEHFKNKPNKPTINVQVTADIKPYGVAVCYRDANNKPVILVGDSRTDCNSMATSVNDEGVRAIDTITPYRMETAQTHYQPVQAQPVVAAAPIAAVSASAAPQASIEAQHKMKSAITDIKKNDKSKDGPSDSPGCCTVM